MEKLTEGEESSGSTVKVEDEEYYQDIEGPPPSPEQLVQEPLVPPPSRQLPAQDPATAPPPAPAPEEGGTEPAAPKSAPTEPAPSTSTGGMSEFSGSGIKGGLTNQ